MKKFLVLLLSFILTLCLCLAGCEEISGTTSSGSSSGTSSDGSGGDVPESAYTVTLALPNETDKMPDLTGVQARWSDSTSSYTADFDSNGLAYYDGLDGEYIVTIVGSVEGYTYDPNGYTAYGTESGRNVVIDLLEILDFSGSSGDGSGLYGNSLQANETGAYRIEFTYSGQFVYFNLLPVQTGYNYTIYTYVSVVDNEACPSVTVYTNSNQGVSGGYANGKVTLSNPNITFTATASGTYTKNFAITKGYNNTSTSSGFCFAFGITTVDGDYSEPVYLDIYITQGGVYDNSASPYDKVEVEDYNSNYIAPTGTITWVSDLYKDFSYCDVNYHDDDGYWYITYNGTEYLLFVELASCHYGIDVGYNFYGDGRWQACGDQNLSYVNVIMAYYSTATTDHMHPVTNQLQEFLYYRAYSISPGPLFFDGSGVLEKTPYELATDDSHGWLFACGFYMG
ncbi:MAG: hypothetical protein LUI60_03175 [Clostridia bacterium]|nr:hypothetical protein [Clostridia bacterium]